MGKGIQWIMLVVFMPVLVSAEVSDLDLLGFEKELHGAVEVAYQSQYIWHGFDVYGEHSAMQVTTELDLFDTGFGVSIAGHRANTRGYENGERWDFSAYYQGSAFRGEPYATQYRVGWFYYLYPQLSRTKMALLEFYGRIEWPNVTGVQGLIPGYSVIALTPVYSGTPGLGSRAAGFLHVGSLDYIISLPGIFRGTPEQIFRFHSELVFNDGVSPFANRVDSGVSHCQVGVSTDIDVGFGIALTPAIDYQMSEEDSVKTDDGFWLTIGARYDF